MPPALGGRTAIVCRTVFNLCRRSNASRCDKMELAIALAILQGVVRSLQIQCVDRLVIVNAHGGNHFQPLVRDLRSEFDVLITVANFYAMMPDVRRAIIETSGDHADESETSMLMYLHPSLVGLASAEKGQLPYVRACQ